MSLQCLKKRISFFEQRNLEQIFIFCSILSGTMTKNKKFVRSQQYGGHFLYYYSTVYEQLFIKKELISYQAK
jgi:hypothetical protein